MYKIEDPAGNLIEIPENFLEDYEYFSNSNIKDAVNYYHENGYVVIRNAVDDSLLDSVNKHFDDEIMPYDGYLYRQTGGNPEKNKFNSNGQIVNPILNIHDLLTKKTNQFRTKGLEALTNPVNISFTNEVFNAPPVLVQSMYFHGNAETWGHQDSYYLDSENFGTMVAGWIALEDIGPGAGRFFIYPKSNRLGLMKNTGSLSVAKNHSGYKKEIIKWMQENELQCRAPALKKGDVLFWNANTVHGSLKTTDPEMSRRSLTCHFIPQGDRFIQFHSREIALNLSKFNGIDIHNPKPLNSLRRRSILYFETRFPKTFQWLKWRAVAFIIK